MSVEVPKPVNPKNFAPFAVILLAGFVASAIAADDATSKTLRFSKRQMFVSPYESCAVGDVNRDGKMDIVYGPYWFEGPEFKIKHEIYPARPQPKDKYADHYFEYGPDRRVTLERKMVMVQTRWGRVPFKVAGSGPAFHAIPEYREVKKLAVRGRF